MSIINVSSCFIFIFGIRVNMENHYKLIVLMVGGNDFCSDICFQKNASVWLNDIQEKALIQTIRYLKDNMPR